MHARQLDRFFIFLVAATGVTWLIGESGSSGPLTVTAILGLAWVKGWLVIRSFMQLHRASLFWNLLLGGWLTLVLALIAITYWKSLT
jgi:uncharacterized membrane protein